MSDREARISRVSLSEKGRELSKKAFDCFTESSYDLFDGFSDAERDALTGLLQRMNDNMASRLQDEEV